MASIILQYGRQYCEKRGVKAPLSPQEEISQVGERCGVQQPHVGGWGGGRRMWEERWVGSKSSDYNQKEAMGRIMTRVCH